MIRPQHTIRARAHPGAILGVWAWQACIALLACWPAAALVRAAYGTDPRGDAVLWAAGGRALMDFLWHDPRGVTAAADGTLLVLLGGAVAGMVPLGALMSIMARPRAHLRMPYAVHASLRVLPAFVLCGVVVGAAQATALGVGAFVGMLSEGWAHATMGEARAELLAIVTGLPFAATAVALGVALDLARAAIVARRVTGLRGLIVGFGAFRSAPLRLSWSWGWRGLASVAPVGLASLWTGHLGAGKALLVLAAVHQAVALGRVALRASWLARALRAVSQTAESER